MTTSIQLTHSGTATNSGAGTSITGTSAVLTTATNYTFSNSSYTIDPSYKGSIVIQTRDGKPLDVGETLTRVTNVLGLITPDKDMLNKYPALKEAYAEYESQLQATMFMLNPKLKSALDGYRTMEALLKASNDE